MSRHNKYQFETRDYDILTNKPISLPTELPILSKTTSLSNLRQPS